MSDRRKNIVFLGLCFGMGILAELSFFHGTIGISFPIFIAVFYTVLYTRLGFHLNHRRIGLLLMVSIWILSLTYLFFDNSFFYLMNLIVIPLLVFVHVVLITTPNYVDWLSTSFLHRLIQKLTQTINYSKRLVKLFFRRTLFRRVNNETTQTIKRIVIGLLMGSPILLVITGLLISADAKFGEVMMEVPNFIAKFNFLEVIIRAGIAVVIAILFFGVFQVLRKRYTPIIKSNYQTYDKNWDTVIVGTILVLLNSIYLLFVFIQFTYFFGDAIQESYTYAEYARRGFFELVLVTVINWSILLACLKLVKTKKKSSSYFMKGMYSLLIITSGIMLSSAYLRLSAYEEAYGFTMDRILAHAFMLFLIVIFAYTLIRVWIEGISLIHFYVIAGVIFYTGLNAINLEEIIVENNIERYEQTGKIDVYYMNSLSYSGIDGLITLYKKDPEYPDLRIILEGRKESIGYLSLNTWQSFNFKKQQVIKRLEELEF
ncbi:DUF4153 domain-containing protein [Ornithinibacillus halotolerans]|uniref:DUF4173 domain-containing protein n=1 Tax=Ornithinibacillus halotolerans TaxID=1274357 RepID=A0A916RZR1_9BACI|nr:DUF4173 domain-containing protein [Ornithinibacillus halotolerans]GGA78007.1 hypothetical protein GCM10008025_21840 [Ornithinibacillus halotolerans]